ncbi:transglutaminase-like cysteine peptidase [Aurantimonas sp. A2-1-M11]|uniref:transglutaminase-like cysteine peptidase n=1 Tax=Aurantimonas sp. A2-1-M11 TaxID=3113712 RepID=UPI002F9488F8
MGYIRAIGATILLCLTLQTGSAQAESRGPFMVVGDTTSPPVGHRLFCHSHPDECRPSGGEAAARTVEPVTLTPELIGAIAQLNEEINRRVEAKSDRELYGVEERWTYPSDANQGDCEDYALLKRKLLNEREGIDLGNLLLTVVRKRDGEGHAILTLRTQRGEFVLDNLDRRVVAWRDAPYRFLKRQSVADPGRWNRVEDGNAVLVGSVAK